MPPVEEFVTRLCRTEPTLEELEALCKKIKSEIKVIGTLELSQDLKESARTQLETKFKETKDKMLDQVNKIEL